MRKAFCTALLECCSDPDLIFLTGDLGYGALEGLRDALGQRFINAGVAEQNMVGVAAGLARGGFQPWVYSIAPFLYARAFEQIRNDVCAHRFPVRLVGVGGGYGYGAQGGTHHALEDYGVLLSLPAMRAFVPAFASDVRPMVDEMRRLSTPAYLRLGLSEEPQGYAAPDYAPWRRLMAGKGPTVVVVGSLVGSLVKNLSELKEEQRPNLWALAELPLGGLPTDLLADIDHSQRLVVVEEHVAQGGLGQMLAASLLLLGLAPRVFVHRSALGYVSRTYGSQRFHRRECKLDPESITGLVVKLASAGSTAVVGALGAVVSEKGLQ